MPHEQLIELNRWYRKAADVHEEWPRGTTRGELLTEPDAPGSTA